MSAIAWAGFGAGAVDLEAGDEHRVDRIMFGWALGGLADSINDDDLVLERRVEEAVGADLLAIVSQASPSMMP